MVWARIIAFDAEVNAEVPAVPLQWNATVAENIRGKEIKRGQDEASSSMAWIRLFDGLDVGRRCMGAPLGAGSI
jgi:hypothetical protein